MRRYRIFGYQLVVFKEKKSGDEKKPRKKLTTWLGKYVEKLSFLSIGLAIATVILCTAGYFWLVPGTTSISPAKGLDLPVALYFSIVSFTSLGFGDIYPLHFGKVITSTEVLLGIMLVAVFIGKIASERQSALLLLVYTSQQQVRIRGFADDIASKVKVLQQACQDKDRQTMIDLAKSTYRYTSSICSYLIVQAENGDVAAFGNLSSLRRLYRAFYGLQSAALDVMNVYGLPENITRTYGNMIGKLSGNAARMLPFHADDEDACNLLQMLTHGGKELTKWNEAIANGTLVLYAETTMTPELLEKVKQKLQTGPLRRNIHRDIANELAISNKLADKCVKHLLASDQGEPS
jgi:hypothetical protein